MRVELALAFLSLISLSCSSLSHRTNALLQNAPQPSAGAPRSIGRYDAGCIAGAQSLPLDGNGYVVMRPSRNRFYGHPELIEMISTLGASAEAQGLGEVLVGDLSQPRGGPMASGHASHQLGLDVDLWYLAVPGSVARSSRETLEAPSVFKQGSLDSSRWGLRQERLLKLAASDARVERIFVNPALKLALCATAGDKTWLAKLRPWSGHDDHFHVRLRCPSASLACWHQEAPPPGDGCQEAVGLAQYFAEQAKLELDKHEPLAVREIKLPQECEALARESMPLL